MSSDYKMIYVKIFTTLPRVLALRLDNDIQPIVYYALLYSLVRKSSVIIPLGGLGEFIK